MVSLGLFHQNLLTVDDINTTLRHAFDTAATEVNDDGLAGFAFREDVANAVNHVFLIDDFDCHIVGHGREGIGTNNLLQCVVVDGGGIKHVSLACLHHSFRLSGNSHIVFVDILNNHVEIRLNEVFEYFVGVTGVVPAYECTIVKTIPANAVGAFNLKGAIAVFGEGPNCAAS